MINNKLVNFFLSVSHQEDVVYLHSLRPARQTTALPERKASYKRWLLPKTPKQCRLLRLLLIASQGFMVRV